MHDSRPLYLMVRPPPGAAQEIDRIRVEHAIPRDYGGDRLHMTLLRLSDAGSLGATGLAALENAAATIGGPPFRVNFDQLDGNTLRGSETMQGAIAFQRRLVRGLTDHGVAWDHTFRFRPHITLAYGPTIARRQSIDPISWLVEELLLIESVTGKARHVEHGRCRLA